MPRLTDEQREDLRIRAGAPSNKYLLTLRCDEVHSLLAEVDALREELAAERDALRGALEKAMGELPTCTRPGCRCAYCLGRDALELADRARGRREAEAARANINASECRIAEAEVTELRAERDALRGALEFCRDELTHAASCGIPTKQDRARYNMGIAKADRALAPQPEPPKPAGADAVPSGDAAERRWRTVERYYGDPGGQLFTLGFYNFSKQFAGKTTRVTFEEEVLPDEPVKGGGVAT
jgi:hypothetical protein